MHESSMKRMQWFINEYLPSPNGQDEKMQVLDVGSYDVNGTYRPLFPENSFRYTGLDMAAGPNVDVVAETPYRWPQLQTDSFDTVISGQAFEHTEFFWETLTEMTRVLKPGGLLCIIVPNGFGEHRYPVDCYRFLADGMIAMARYVRLEILHAHTNRGPSSAATGWYSNREAGSMLIARKTYAGPAQIVELNSYTCTHADLDLVGAPLVPAPNEQPLPKTYVGKRLLGLARKFERWSRSW